MESMGYIMGSAGFVFALMAFGPITTLRKEFDDLKKQLGDCGVLKRK